MDHGTVACGLEQLEKAVDGLVAGPAQQVAEEDPGRRGLGGADGREIAAHPPRPLQLTAGAHQQFA
jgi:hypothetical protein